MNSENRISLDPTASDVGRFNTWFDRKCVESGIESRLAADLKLCLNEVLANLISYGFKNTPDPTIMVEIKLQPGRASATVTDNGSYFDMRTWQVPKDRDLMTGEPGGFGIALINERATRLFCTRIGELNQLVVVCEGTIP
jgi:anti-sigma regulatory factor (Ser/Thr protein kinase)